MEIKHFIACDIGNSCVSYGYFFDGELVASSFFNTGDVADVDRLMAAFRKFSSDNNLDDVEGIQALIASVFPSATRFVEIAVNKVFRTTAKVFDSTYETGIPLDVDDPKEVGADLIAGVVGAVKYHEGKPALIVDLGTVTKNIFVNDKGALYGCAFFPGLESCLAGMSNSTALLPQITEFVVPKSVVGKNSIDAMESGVFYGTIEGIKGLAEKINKKYGQYALKILTGGFTDMISPYLPQFVPDKNLVLRGIYIIATLNND